MPEREVSSGLDGSGEVTHVRTVHAIDTVGRCGVSPGTDVAARRRVKAAAYFPGVVVECFIGAVKLWRDYGWRGSKRLCDLVVRGNAPGDRR